MMNFVVDKLVYPLKGKWRPCGDVKHLWGSGAPCLWSSSPKGKRAVVFLHGNRSYLDTHLNEFITLFGLQAEADVLAITYPGYPGGDDASAASGAAYDSNQAMACACAAREVSSKYDEVWLMGHSLGCSAVIEASRLYPAAGIVLLSPFVSLKRATAHLYGDFLAWMCPDRLDNHASARRVLCKTLIVHGLADEVVPVQQSAELLDALTACPQRHRVTLPEVTHALSSDYARIAGEQMRIFSPRLRPRNAQLKLQFRDAAS